MVASTLLSFTSWEWCEKLLEAVSVEQRPPMLWRAMIQEVCICCQVVHLVRLPGRGPWLI